MTDEEAKAKGEEERKAMERKRDAYFAALEEQMGTRKKAKRAKTAAAAAGKGWHFSHVLLQEK
jgi:hypothetical protein